MGHKTIECVERPRSAKSAAWKSNRTYAKDDIVLKLEDHGKVRKRSIPLQIKKKNVKWTTYVFKYDS